MVLPHPVLHGLVDAQENFDALTRQAPVEVAALPATPFDGQIVYFAADATNGVVWRLRYNASSASAYQWEFVGGSPLRSHVDTDETFTEDGTWHDASTAGPSIALPLDGDFAYIFSANCYAASQTAANAVAVGLAINGATPASADQASMLISLSTGMTLTKPGELLGRSASDSVKVRYNLGAGAGGTPHARFRELQIIPVRVG